MAKQNKYGPTPMSEDVSAWYNDIVFKADLADNGPAKGTMVMKPYGYGIWELIQSQLDAMFKATGHKNAYFPMFIPESYLKREADHVEGFAPELAIVTHAGGKELGEPLVVRPTSETIIGEMYSKWINSHRDLPVLINQWANVVRWEKRPRIFLRTTEFLWQEGHTAHADAEDAMRETNQMWHVYADFSRDVAAIPMVMGEKTPGERFAGAVRTFTIEGMMRDGKALQSGTSHYMGTNFAKAFDISFTDKSNTKTLCHTTSWGMSTRMVGAVILAHGDDDGLVLPPRLAPTQLIIIPAGRGEDGERCVEQAHIIAAELRACGVRVDVDDRDQGPGFKMNDAILKGIPLRAEIGPRDLEAGVALVAHRIGEVDENGRAVKEPIALTEMADWVPAALDAYHDTLLARATAFRDDNTATLDTWEAFEAQVQTGFANVLHCGVPACEDDIKDATKATPRCVLIDGEDASGSCVRCGEPSAYGKRVTFSRAY
ncbi:MAG: prolyl-tRNA synthetase [Myxococcota bacterium]